MQRDEESQLPRNASSESLDEERRRDGHETSSTQEGEPNCCRTVLNMLNSPQCQIGGPFLTGIAFMAMATFTVDVLDHETRQYLGVTGLTFLGGAGIGFFSQWCQGNIVAYNTDNESPSGGHRARSSVSEPH